MRTGGMESNGVVSTGELPGAPATVRRRSRRRAAGIAGAALAMLALAFGVHALFDTRRPANELPRETLFAASTVSPAQWRATLEQQARRAPRDGRAWMLLARADFAAERYVDAAAS